MACGKANEYALTDDHSHANHFCCDCKYYEGPIDETAPCLQCLYGQKLGCKFEAKEEVTP